MKKFNFSLEKLLKYKNQIKDSERANLMGLVAEKNIMVNKVSNLYEQDKETKNKIHNAMNQGVKAQEIIMYNFVIENCRNQIHFLKRDIAILEKNIEKQQKRVAEISREVQALEKLREKKLEEYEELVNKEQNRVIEEYVSQKAFENLQNRD